MSEKERTLPARVLDAPVSNEWRPVNPPLLIRVADAVAAVTPKFLRPALREIRYRFRGEMEVAPLRAEVSDLHKQWTNILGNSGPSPEITSENPHILFVTGFGLGTHVVTREPILMMALRRRGCRISSLYCDATLPACEFNRNGNHVPNPGSLSDGITKEARLTTCNRCSMNVRTSYDLLGIECHAYHEFVGDTDMTIAQAATANVPFEQFREFEYEGIAVGEEAFASLLRVTFMGNVQDTEANRVLVKRYLLSGVVMSRAAEAAFLRLKPDRILLPHGVYLTHGIAAKVARKLGIPVIAYRGGDRKHTLILSHNETYHRTLVNEPNDVWDKTDLTPAQRERTLSYVHAKRKGGADTFNYHPSPIEDTRMLYEQLGIDNKRPIVTLFTNVIWDAQIYYDGLAFSDILEWMRFSIEELAKNRNVWAVIRVHPAEVKGGLPTNQPILGEIHKWFPKLPDNFRVVPPESNLSSYTLGDHSKAAIIYGTKMGLELAVRGVPVIVAGETFSRNKGYGIDIASKEQYAALIARIHQIEPMSKERKERALRYAHYLYFRRFIDLPYLHMGDKERPGKHLEFASLEHLDPGRDEKLDVLCDAIIQLGPTHLPPNA